MHMFTAKKHYRHTYLFIVLCIFVSCINIHQTSVPILFTQSFSSGFPNDIYTTSATSSNDDACTPEMLGRQELYSYSNIVHKKNNFSKNCKKSILYKKIHKIILKNK